MADTKITGLVELLAVDPSDLLAIVDDPAGVPVTKKVTVENLQTDWHVGARVYHNVNQSLATTTNTALAFNQERYDNDTIHDTAINNSRLTCNTAGKYLIWGIATFAGNVVGRRVLSIELNGSGTLLSYVGRWNGGGGLMGCLVMCEYDLIVTDYVELIAFQDSGGALNVNASGNYSPEFGMRKVG